MKIFNNKVKTKQITLIIIGLLLMIIYFRLIYQRKKKIEIPSTRVKK